MKDTCDRIDKSISREQVSPLTVKSCAGDDVDMMLTWCWHVMIDLTDICDWKVDVPSFKLLHKFTEDLLICLEIVILKLFKLSKINKLNLNLKQLSWKIWQYPPPAPAHLIFENEDVLKQNYVDNLDISSEDIPKFLVTKTEIYTEHLTMKNTDNVPELLITEKNKLCFSWSKVGWCSSAKSQCSKKLTSELRD